MAAERVREFFLRWADLQGRQCVVSIVDTEVLSGGTVELSAGLNPFVVSGDDDSDPLCAIRLHPAQIGVRDNYTLLGRFEFTSVTRYRVQCRREGGIVWQGWLKCDALSQSYSSVKDEIILDCIDDIEALKAFDVSASDWDKELPSGPPVRFEGIGAVVSVKAVLCECLARVSHITGGDGLNLVFSDELALPHCKYRDLLVSKGVFFEEADIDIEDEESTLYTPMTCYEAVEEICRSAGWTCQEVGNTVYFTTSNNEGKTTGVCDWSVAMFPNSVPLEDMGAVEALSSGGSHDISVLSGVHKLCVSVERDVRRDLGLDIANGAKFVSDEGVVATNLPKKLKAFSLTNPRIKTRNFEASLTVEDWNNSVPPTVSEIDDSISSLFHRGGLPHYDEVNTGNHLVATCGRCWCTVAKTAWYEDTDTNYNYKYSIVASAVYPFILGTASNDYGLKEVINIGYEMPFVEIDFGTYTFTNGALSFNFLLETISLSKNYYSSRVGLLVMVGDRFFSPGAGDDPDEWLSANEIPPYSFLALLNNEKTCLADTKKATDPYNGATGLVMPINGTISGSVKVIIYGLGVVVVPGILTRANLYYLLNDISLKYYPTDADNCFEPRANVKYRAYSDKWGEDGITVRSLLHSMKDNVSDNGILLRGDNMQPLEKSLCWSGVSKRPEEALLERYKYFYFRGRKMLTLELEDDLTFPCIYTDESGERWQLLCCVGYDYARGVGRWLFVNLINVQ